MLAGICSSSASEQRLYNLIDLSAGGLEIPNSATRPITIAIVDDGFNPDHQSLFGFTQPANQEIPNNRIDDDGNGYVDDTVGYDVSDSDSKVTPPDGRQADFYHGTFSASIIANIIRTKLGKMDEYPVRLLYVKAVSDYSQSMRLDSAYDGIQYALDQGADIISNSWSGGSPREVDTAVLSNALRADVFIVNTVGNFQLAEPALPANHPAVFGVGGTDFQGVLGKEANFGTEVDILAPEEPISGAAVSSNDGYQSGEGTSVASPMVAATAALMKLINPSISAAEITGCLHNTARSVEHRNPMHAGKVGAGMLQVDAAIECARKPVVLFAQSHQSNTRGTIAIGSDQFSSTYPLHEWLVKPVGAYQGIRFRTSVSGNTEGLELSVFNAESQLSEPPLWHGALDQIPEELYLAKSAVRLQLTGFQGQEFVFSSRYVVDPIDFEKRFCSGRITLDTDSVVADGSGNSYYADRSDCQWLIKHRPGYDIHIRFVEFSLEEKDSVFLYGGDQAKQRNLFSTFNGDSIPETVSVTGGDALLWFLSDPAGQGAGFEIDIRWVPSDS